MPVLQQFSPDRGIRFTLPFGKAITIGAIARSRMLLSAPRWARSRFFTAFRREQSKWRCGDFRKDSARLYQRRHGNEGVGEHVRTRFHLRLVSPVKLRTLRSAPNEENLFLLPDRFSGKSELFKKYDPAV
jgi:hypothetical protein